MTAIICSLLPSKKMAGSAPVTVASFLAVDQLGRFPCMYCQVACGLTPILVANFVKVPCFMSLFSIKS